MSRASALATLPTPHFLDIADDVVVIAHDRRDTEQDRLESVIAELKREAAHYREMAAVYDAEIARLTTARERP